MLIGVNRIEQQQSNIDKIDKKDKQDVQDRVPYPVHPDYPCELKSHVLTRDWCETHPVNDYLNLLYPKTG